MDGATATEGAIDVEGEDTGVGTVLVEGVDEPDLANDLCGQVGWLFGYSNDITDCEGHSGVLIMGQD